jgi:hypothetical protein
MADVAALANKTIRYILLYLRNILTNLYRRGLILLKYGGIWWQKRRLGKQFHRLGDEIYTKYTAGDVNPLLQEEVKDLLAAIQRQVEALEARRQAIQQIRDQIKATSYRLPEAAQPAETPAETTETGQS